MQSPWQAVLLWSGGCRTVPGVLGGWAKGLLAPGAPQLSSVRCARFGARVGVAAGLGAQRLLAASQGLPSPSLDVSEVEGGLMGLPGVSRGLRLRHRLPAARGRGRPPPLPSSGHRVCPPPGPGALPLLSPSRLLPGDMAHAVVLASVSSFFLRFLEGRTREQHQSPLPCVPLPPGATLWGWRAVLAFAYGGTVPRGRTKEVEESARALGAPRVAAACALCLDGDSQGGGPEPLEEQWETLRAMGQLHARGLGCDLQLQAGDEVIAGEPGAARRG
uniref:BTB domain-containing protein n=1 Tax=Amazona collaria TaxID=241587 RepID=A0A8B9GGA8_9PSIT